MSRQPKIIHVAPESELAHLLEEAASAPVILEKDGEFFRLDREETKAEDVWARCDPEQVGAALERSIGALAHVDREELLKDLREQREQDSYGRPA
ncbi:MAG: hypothetical protein EPO21_08850 [Chloroflexota bacterium]|nr:MAG: hypothetical protein EPO21_08850 [Chloroflexota bacterium]